MWHSPTDRPSVLRLSLPLRLAALVPLFSPRPDDPFHSGSAREDGCRSSQSPPQPHRWAVHVMDTAGSKMNLNFAFRLQIRRIERYFMVLLFSPGLDQERIP